MFSTLASAMIWILLLAMFLAGSLLLIWGLLATRRPHAPKLLRIGFRSRWPVIGSGLVLWLGGGGPLAIAVAYQQQQQAIAAIQTSGGQVLGQKAVLPLWLVDWMPGHMDRYLIRTTRVDLSEATDLDTQTMALLGRLTSLSALDAGNPRLDDEAIGQLRGMKQLRWLDLGHTQLTDAGLARLANLTLLRWLDIPDTAVTDKGLLYLLDMRRLETLDVRRTAVTDAGAQALQRELPDLLEVWVKVQPDQTVHPIYAQRN